VTRVGLLRRRRGRFELASPELLGAVDLPADGACVRAAVTADGAVRITVRTRFARLTARRVLDGLLLLEGELHGASGPLTARRRSDGREIVVAAHGGFHATLPLALLHAAPPSPEAAVTGGPGAPEMWDLAVGGLPLALPAELDGMAWRTGAHEAMLERTRTGDAAIVTRRVVTPIVTPAPALDVPV
jgi:hypothetical protein